MSSLKSTFEINNGECLLQISEALQHGRNSLQGRQLQEGFPGDRYSLNQI